MSLLRTLIITFVNTGMDNEYIQRFLKAWTISLPIAIGTAFFVGPFAKKFVDKTEHFKPSNKPRTLSLVDLQWVRAFRIVSCF